MLNPHDNNPDRRNLIMLSLSIIIFYLGGGTLTDNSETVKLQLINVTFQNPQILVYFVWIMLFWFAYRYWLLNRDSWQREYNDEMPRIYSTKLSSYFQKHFQKHFQEHLNLEDDSILISTALVYSSSVPPGIGFKFKNRIRNVQGSHKEVFGDITTPYDYYIIIVCTIVTAIFKPTLTSYFTSYFLFAVAVGLGLSHWIVFDM